jgi:hypothetical protein
MLVALLGRPSGLPDCPGFQGRRFLRLAAFGINSKDTTGSLFHHCSERAMSASASCLSGRRSKGFPEAVSAVGLSVS